MSESIYLINAIERVDFELGKAIGKHPVFPCENADGLNIITEEMLELMRAVNDSESSERQIEEAAHVAVTAIRFIESCLKKEKNLSD